MTFKCLRAISKTFTGNLSVTFMYLGSVYTTWCIFDELILLKDIKVAYFKGKQHLSEHSLLCESASSTAPAQPLTTNITIIICFLCFSWKWWNSPPIKCWCFPVASSPLILNISAADLCSGIALWPRNLPHPYRTCHGAGACVLTENQAIRVKRQFSSNPENKRLSKLLRKTWRKLWYVEQVGEAFYSSDWELNCTHCWPQHLPCAGLYTLAVTPLETRGRWVQMETSRPCLN